MRTTNERQSNRNMVFKWFSSIGIAAIARHIVADDDDVAVGCLCIIFFSFSHFCTKNEIASD